MMHRMIVARAVAQWWNEFHQPSPEITVSCNGQPLTKGVDYSVKGDSVIFSPSMLGKTVSITRQHQPKRKRMAAR